MTGSQANQDKFVLEHLGHMRNGYFLEMGASDGITFSNTYKLEKEYGWSGLLVECDPQMLQSLRNHRSSTIDTRPVWSHSNIEVAFKSIENGALSGIESNLIHPKSLVRSGKILYLNTISLDDLLQQHECPQHINYFSLDVEGSEYNILSTYSFRHIFDVITVEHLKNQDEITSLICSKGYKVKDVLVNNKETIFVRNI